MSESNFDRRIYVTRLIDDWLEKGADKPKKISLGYRFPIEDVERLVVEIFAEKKILIKHEIVINEHTPHYVLVNLIE